MHTHTIKSLLVICEGVTKPASSNGDSTSSVSTKSQHGAPAARRYYYDNKLMLFMFIVVI